MKITVETSYDLHHKQKGKYFLNKILDRTDNQLLIDEVKSLNIFKIESFLDVDLGLLQKALDQIVVDNDILRTAFLEIDGMSKQVVYKAADVLAKKLFRIDYFNQSGQKPISEYIKKPFQFERIPLLRLGVFQNKDDSFMILLVVNHIICDDRSLMIICDKLEQYYELLILGKSLPQEKLKSQMKDYVQKEVEIYSGKEGARRVEFWRRQIAKLDKTFPFKGIYKGGYKPSNYYREMFMKDLNHNFRDLKQHEIDNLIGTYHRGMSWAGSSIGFYQSGEVYEQVITICKEVKCTVFVFMLMVWKLYLSNRFDGKNLGVSYETNYPIWAPCYKMIGWFTNTIPCATVVSSERSVVENLRTVQREHLETIEHYQYPIDQILATTDFTLDAISPVFLNYFSNDIDQEEQDMSPTYTENSTWLYHDLDVYVHQKKNCLKLVIKFKKKLFEKSFIEDVVAGFSQTVDQCISDYRLAKEGCQPMRDTRRVNDHVN